MQSQLFSCSVCYTEFDNKEKKPKIIPGCGHTICLFCLERILGMSKPMCPLDRKPLTRKVEDYSTNIIVLQLIEEKEQSQGGCALHNNEPSNLVCLDDKCVICKYCAEYGDHKGHKIKHVNDVQKEANTQRIRLKDMIDALEEEEQAIYKELDENKEGLLDEYKKRYVSLKEEVARREQKSFHAIQEFFALKRLMVSQKLKSQLMMKEKLQKKVQDLSNVNNCQAFFDAFKGEADEIAAATAGHIEEDQSVKEKALRMVEEFRSKFVTELEKLEENVTSLLKHDSEHEMDASLPHMDEEDVLKILKFSKKLGKLVVAPLKEDEKRSEVLKLPEECNKIILDFSKTSASDDALLAISWLFNKFGRKINDVKIDISDKSIPVSDLLELYSPLFYIISSAEIIELVLTSCDVSDKHLKEILNTKLSCVKTLKGIRLQLRGTKITDRGVEFISDFVRSKKDTIENFYLNASATQVSDSSIEKLCTSFSPHMKNFSLILNSAAGITDKTVELINQHILPLSENWKVLALHFFETKISDTSIIKLLASLREKVPTLTHFFFEVGKTKVTEKSLEFYITEILPRLQGLESFMLGAASLKLDGMIIQNLLEAFNCETFKNLEYFALSLDNVPFSDKHLEYFAKNILVDMKKVESLIFTLTGASLTDAGVEPFFIMMKEIAEKIKFLNLRLVKNVQVSDKSVELFDKQIFPLLVNLEAFTFQVDRTQVSDHGRNLLSAMEKQVLDRDINMII